MLCRERIGTEITAPHLFLDNCASSVLTETRDLRIIVNDSLSPAAHVMVTVSKAHTRSALIIRAFTSQDAKLLIRVYVVICDRY